MPRSISLWLLVILAGGWLFGVTDAAPANAAAKKVVFIAGRKSHGPGEHEYELGSRLLARCIETSPDLRGWRAEVHLYGWPERPETLNDADTIAVYCDGPDHREEDDPLLTGDRLEQLGRQMRRGCGIVLLHYATFAPVKRGGPEYLDWAGGYFDYETGAAANHWFSKIQVVDAAPAFPSPRHPILRGVQPFRLKDEFYYNMRMRPDDPCRANILDVAFPGDTSPGTVAWAVQRADGGRGFAFTGGHSHSNWQNENLRRLVLNAIVWTARAAVPDHGVRSTVAPDQDAIRALILTGYHMPAHDWRATTPALRDILLRDHRFTVAVCEDPEQLASTDLSRYDLIIQNYCNWDRPSLSEPSRRKLLDFVRAGGGLAVIHFANGAWRDWPDYYGRLARRIWVDDKSSHDAFGPFRVHVGPAPSLLTEGLSDFDTVDELYCNQQGALPVEPLLTARSKTSGKEEPLAFVYTEGKGRIFQTLLGHDAAAINTPAHAEVIRRACEWIACREVIPMPLATRASPNPAVPLLSAPPRAGLLGEGRFGSALDGRRGALAAPGLAIYQEPPLTVECWARLFGKTGFNVLVANSTKESPKHWELYTMAGSGTFAVYLPGVTPTNIDSRVDVVDGKWHALAMTYLPGRIRLFVDGRAVADQAIGAPHQAPVVGPLWIGGYPQQNIGCDGFVDEVRISNTIRDIAAAPQAPFALDGHTIGLWRLDALQDGRAVDIAPAANAARKAAAPASAPGASPLPQTTSITRVLPRVRRSTTVDWPNVGNDKGGTRYSPMRQIDRNNAKDLKVAWIYHCGDAAAAGTTIECTPIVIDGVMYLTTPRLKVVALDAATGGEIWKFDAHAPGVNRGVAYWSDGKPGGKRRILVSFTDARLYSLDAFTGKLDPDFGTAGIVDLRAGIERDISQFGYGSTSAPMVYENLVILGFLSSEGGPGAPGDIRAFDCATGREAWRFHTVPRPGEAFNEIWPGSSWKERPGVNPWSGFTLDDRRGILFCGTGSAASDFYGADRPGANLFANSTLALDARNGKYLWHFQEVHHDLWDHDNPCPPVLIDVRRGGRRVPAVAQPTKTGFLYIFDRLTGKPLFDVHEVPATGSDIPGEAPFPTQPEPAAPPPFSPQRFTEADVTNISPEAHEYVLGQLRTYAFGKPYQPATLQGTIVAPGFHGGATWSGASFDPTTGLVYVNSNNAPYILRLQANSAGGYDFMGYTYFNDQNGYPAGKPPWGLVNAIVPNKGAIAWQTPLGEFPALAARGVPRTGTENFGGTIVTAGGLVFIGGSKDEKFHAFDKATGKLLWDYKLDAGGYATPCTYMVNGRQYVVIAAGGGGKPNTKSGDAYVAFALPH